MKFNHPVRAILSIILMCPKLRRVFLPNRIEAKTGSILPTHISPFLLFFRPSAYYIFYGNSICAFLVTMLLLLPVPRQTSVVPSPQAFILSIATVPSSFLYPNRCGWPSRVKGLIVVQPALQE